MSLLDDVDAMAPDCVIWSHCTSAAHFRQAALGGCAQPVGYRILFNSPDNSDSLIILDWSGHTEFIGCSFSDSCKQDRNAIVRYIAFDLGVIQSIWLLERVWLPRFSPPQGTGRRPGHVLRIVSNFPSKTCRYFTNIPQCINVLGLSISFAFHRFKSLR